MSRAILLLYAAAVLIPTGTPPPPGLLPLDRHTASELGYFELLILRSEVYARHGYCFRTRWIMDLFLSREWYVPCKPGERAEGEPSRELSPEEERRVALINEAISGLEPTLSGAWPVDRPDSTDTRYYAEIHLEPLPPEVSEAAPSGPLGNALSHCGMSPSTMPYDLLPADLAAPIYERPDSVMDFMDGLEANARSEIAATVNEALAPYGLGTSDTVYRTFWRSESLLVCVEAVAIGSRRWSLMLDPYVAWRMCYDRHGLPTLFQPAAQAGGWSSRTGCLAFGSDDGRPFIRVAVHGDLESIDMVVYDGPFSGLPMEVNLYSLERDGAERFVRLTGGL